MSTEWMVQREFIHGWDDADWHDGDQPWRFPSRKAAEAEIRELVNGAPHMGYTINEFRAVRVIEPNPFHTCWGGTEHTFREYTMSVCESGCKVYECEYCKRRQVLHNPSYGCRRINQPGEAA